MLIGLISLVPVAGWLNLFGWMLAALDNLRAGRPQLPPATFAYIGRGANLFVVYFVYGLVLGVAFGIFFGVGIVIVAGTDGEANAVGIPLILMAYALLLLGGLAWYLVTPAVIVATERGGDPRRPQRRTSHGDYRLRRRRCAAARALRAGRQSDRRPRRDRVPHRRDLHSALWICGARWGRAPLRADRWAFGGHGRLG